MTRKTLVGSPRMLGRSTLTPTPVPSMARLASRSLLLAALVWPGAVACVSLDYDLSQVPVPISAKPATSGEVEPFAIEAHNVLYVHGLFGRNPPSVEELVSERAQGYDGIANFRVRQTSNVSQWLLTHLSLTLVRMRTVEIEGELVRDR